MEKSFTFWKRARSRLMWCVGSAAAVLVMYRRLARSYLSRSSCRRVARPVGSLEHRIESDGPKAACRTPPRGLAGHEDGLEMGHLLRALLDPVELPGVGDEGPGPAVVQDVGDLVRLGRGIDHQEHG